VEVNEAGHYSFTPLHVAAENSHEAVVWILLECNAEINAADKNSKTPLHAAAKNRHEAVVQLLLEHDPDVNAADKDGCVGKLENN
jgi:ankyrin repeat protein